MTERKLICSQNKNCWISRNRACEHSTKRTVASWLTETCSCWILQDLHFGGVAWGNGLFSFGGDTHKQPDTWTRLICRECFCCDLSQSQKCDDPFPVTTTVSKVSRAASNKHSRRRVSSHLQHTGWIIHMTQHTRWNVTEIHQIYLTEPSAKEPIGSIFQGNALSKYTCNVIEQSVTFRRSNQIFYWHTWHDLQAALQPKLD